MNFRFNLVLSVILIAFLSGCKNNGGKTPQANTVPPPEVKIKAVVGTWKRQLKKNALTSKDYIKPHFEILNIYYGDPLHLMPMLYSECIINEKGKVLPISEIPSFIPVPIVGLAQGQNSVSILLSGDALYAQLDEKKPFVVPITLTIQGNNQDALIDLQNTDEDGNQIIFTRSSEPICVPPEAEK